MVSMLTPLAQRKTKSGTGTGTFADSQKSTYYQYGRLKA
jgi:hypothetical protein